ncbi:hypothetical protein TYRP_023096 [Tyrophagus putrescentiae]|nr:hypothetical protein TYRP_023096 [Tyrophagus putrescentiae]
MFRQHRLHLFTDALIIIKKRSYFERYFNTIQQIAKEQTVPSVLYLMKGSLWSKLLLTLLFYFHPKLSASCRLFLLDYFTITGLGVEFNLLMFAIFLSAYLFVDQLYLSGSGNDYIRLPHEVLIRRKWMSVFLQPCYRGKKIIDLLEKVALRLGNAFAGVVVPSSFFSPTASFTSCLKGTFWKVLVLHFNCATAYIAIHSFDNIYQLSMLVPALGALINFIRLKQADRLLLDLSRRLKTSQRWQEEKTFRGRTCWNVEAEEADDHNSRLQIVLSNVALENHLQTFYRFHTTIRVSIFRQNSILGFQLLAYILLYTPVNAYQLTMMIFTTVPALTTLIFLRMIFGQVTSIFGLHLVAVQYPVRIHQAGKLLNDIYVRLLLRRFKARELLRCSHQMEVLNVRLKERRYGITYGPAHLVTMSTFVTAHLHYLFTNLDPVKDRMSNGDKNDFIPKNKKQRLNQHYLLPFLLMAGYEVHSLYVLYQNSFHYDPKSLADLYTHKYFPDQLALQGSAMAHWGITLELFTYGKLIFEHFIPSQYLMILNRGKGESQRVHSAVKLKQGGRYLEKEITVKVLSFRRKAKAFFTVLLKMEVFQVVSYFGYQAFGRHWQGTPTDHVFGFALPLYAFYAVYGAISLIYYFLLSLKYLEIKQQHLLERLKVTKKMPHTWASFMGVNGKLLAFFEELSAYNAFWSYYLSCCFISYTGMICYLSYGLLKTTPVGDLFLSSFFLFFLSEFVLILLVLCAVCSLLVRNNVAVYREILKFCYAFRRHYRPSTVQHLTMDRLIVDYSGARQVGFRLANSALIDAEMFQFLFLYISTLFFKLVKPKKVF